MRSIESRVMILGLASLACAACAAPALEDDSIVLYVDGVGQDDDGNVIGRLVPADIESRGAPLLRPEDLGCELVVDPWELNLFLRSRPSAYPVDVSAACADVRGIVSVQDPVTQCRIECLAACETRWLCVRSVCRGAPRSTPDVQELHWDLRWSGRDGPPIPGWDDTGWGDEAGLAPAAPPDERGGEGADEAADALREARGSEGEREGRGSSSSGSESGTSSGGVSTSGGTRY